MLNDSVRGGLEIALLFRRKIRSILSTLRLLPVSRNQCDCHFSIRSLAELVDCGLLSELGVECLSGLWEDLSPYYAA